MKQKLLFFLALLLFGVSSFSQQLTNSKLYADYRYDKGTAALVDFSYVGYHQGDIPIPEGNYHRVFNVTHYGANPNDNQSDWKGIDSAIRLAKANGSGIVFFPPGRFLVNESYDPKKSFVIDTSNIVLRGSGSGPGGTEIFMSNSLRPEDTTKMWTTPKMFIARPTKKDGNSVGKISSNAKIGDFNITLTQKGNLNAGDWIRIYMKSPQSHLLQYEIGNLPTHPKWKITTDGVRFEIYYRIKSINGNTLTLYQPLAYPVSTNQEWSVYKTTGISEIGFEDIAFVGNWKTPFKHHDSWLHNSGYSMLELNKTFNSWIRNCRFVDVNIAATTTGGANISVLNCTIAGNPGHEAIFNSGATNVLLKDITDMAKMWHSVGVDKGSFNTVLHNVTYDSETSFESHASQPRNTLLDNVEGGLHTDRAGGDTIHMPNHLKNLIFWNYKQTNAPKTNFNFWPVHPWYWRIPYPIIAGFSGGTSFDTTKIHKNSEWKYTQMYPSSLYLAQLEQRKSPTPWASGANWSYSVGTQKQTFINTTTASNCDTTILPVPTGGGQAGLYIRSSGNAAFSLNGDHTMSLNTSTAGTLSRFSVNTIPIATSVACFSFNINFSEAGLPDAGNYIFAIGNNKSKLFLPCHLGSVYRSSDELFTALRWTPSNLATSTAITFAYRVGSDASSTTTYNNIIAAHFVKGGQYYVEVFCNNSGIAQTYTVSSISYSLPNNTFHIWVNGIKLGNDYPRSIEVNGSTGLTSGSSIALSNGSALNSFLFSSNNGTNASSGKITLYYPAVSYLTNTGGSILLKQKETLQSLASTSSNSKEFQIYLDDNNYIHINAYSDKTQLARLKIYDIMGRQLIAYPLELVVGINEHKIKLLNLSSGTYIAVFESEGKFKRIKFVK